MKYKCENCDFETEHRGAYNLHVTMHCPAVRKRTEKQEKKKHEHEWEFLNPKVSEEKRAMVEGGYREVCRSCLELR